MICSYEFIFKEIFCFYFSISFVLLILWSKGIYANEVNVKDLNETQSIRMRQIQAHA